MDRSTNTSNETQGDSGGPMMLRDSETNRYSVVGVVSAGIGCALKDLPGIYTRVNAYVPWIHKYIYAWSSTTLIDIV